MNDIELYEKSGYESDTIKLVGVLSDYTYSLQWHEQMELHFVLSGVERVRCGSQLYSVSENELLIINSNELHECTDTPEYKSFVIRIHPEFLNNKSFPFKKIVSDDEVIRFMNKIMEIHKNKDDASLFLIKGYLYELISFLISNHTEGAGGKQDAVSLAVMNEIASYIHKNYTSDIKTESLVAMSHYSYAHFCHTFRNAFGMSAMKYLLTLRLNKAAGLLLSSDMNMTEIASVCGFSDSNYFSRVFKKEMGISPLKYRSGGK